MPITLCPHCTNRIYNTAKICLHCLAASDPSRLRIAPPSTRMPALDSRLVGAWAFTFQVIARAGGADLPRLRLLTWAERLVVFFNPWALLLGPLYYLSIGLRTAALAMAAGWLLLPAGALLLLGRALKTFAGPQGALYLQWLSARPLAWLAVWLCAALAFAVRANRDFFRKLEREEAADEAKWGFSSYKL
ncbi:MAG: hypothetical protein EOP81_01305 [Variovorax sp.]|nr:MAG: hypothetical protein EOP81_01305 [Variovorax sp.]